MGLINDLRQRLENSLRASPTATNTNAPPLSSKMNILGLPEAPEPKESEQLDAYRGWVYSCIRAIAEEVSKIELILYKKKGDELEQIETHEALEALHRVNNFQTQIEFFEGIQSYLELTGESFVYKFGKGINRELWILRPDWVKVLPPKKNEDFIGGYSYNIPGTNNPVLFSVDEIIQFKYFNPKNPYRGMSPLKAAAYAYDTDFFATKWNRNFFYNNAIPSAILTTEQNLKEKEIKRIKSEWRAKFAGVKKAHMFAILTGGLKFDQGFKQSMKDMEFLNLRRFSRDEIFSIFQVPKTLVSITEDVNRANAAEHKAVFIENVIKPKMSRLVSFLNEFYLPDYGDDLIFGYKDPSPENVESDLKIVDSGLKGPVGWMTINEARDLMGYDNIGPEGDVIFTGFNMLPYSGGEDTGKAGKMKIVKEIKVKPKEKNKDLKGVFVKNRITAGDILKSKVKEKIAHSPEFKKLVYLLMSKNTKEKKNKKDDGDGFKRLPRDKAEAFWRQMIARSEPQEVTFRTKLNAFFKRQEAEILDKVGTIKNVKLTKSTDRFLYDINDENDILIEVVHPLMQKIVAQAGTDALRLVGVSDAFKFIDEVIKIIRDYELLLVNSVNKTTYDKLKKVIQEGIGNNQSVDEISANIRSVYKNATKFRSKQIARTETIRANNLGHIAGYKQSNLVEFKEWLVTPDDRTCEFCLEMERSYSIRGLDENFLTKGTELKGVNGGVMTVDYSDLLAPPLHNNCRCTVIPVVKLA